MTTKPATLDSDRKGKKSSTADAATVGRPPSEPDLTLFSRRVAKLIRQAREAAGMTVPEVAAWLADLSCKAAAGSVSKQKAAAVEALKIPQEASDNQFRMLHYESGRRPIPLDLIPLLAGLYKVQVRDVIPEK